MSTTIKVTDETKAYFDAVANEGVYSWKQGTGIAVSGDTLAAMELLHEVAAGATISVSRQGGRITSITITTGGSSQILDVLQEGLSDAIDSHDDLEEQDGYLP
jgi:hypothetical protein